MPRRCLRRRIRNGSRIIEDAAPPRRSRPAKVAQTQAAVLSSPHALGLLAHLSGFGSSLALARLRTYAPAHGSTESHRPRPHQTLSRDNSFSVVPDFSHWLARVCPRPHVARLGGLWRFPNYRARRIDHRRSPDRRRSLGQCPPDEPIQPSEFTASPRPWLSPVSAHTHRNYLVHAARPHRRYLRRVSLPRLCHGRVASRRPRHLARGHPLLCDVRHSPPVSGQSR